MPLLLLDATGRLIVDDVSDKVGALARVPVFADMSRKELRAIARNLDEAEVEAGTTLIREGQSNHAFWIVVEGELEVRSRGKLLRRIRPHGQVGGPSMLDGRPAWATVTTVTPVKALVASRQQFHVVSADDRVGLRLMAETGAILREHMLDSMREAG